MKIRMTNFNFVLMATLTAISGCSSTNPAGVNPETPKKEIAYKPMEKKRLDGQSLEHYFSSTLTVRKFECENIAQTGHYADRYRSEDAKKYSDELTKCLVFSKKEADKIFRDLSTNKRAENAQKSLKDLYSSWSVFMSQLSVYSKPMPMAELNFRKALEAYNIELKVNNSPTN